MATLQIFEKKFTNAAKPGEDRNHVVCGYATILRQIGEKVN